MTTLLSYLDQLVRQSIALLLSQHANETTVLLDLAHQIQQTVGYIMSQHPDESYPPYIQSSTSQLISTNTVPTIGPHHRKRLPELYAIEKF